MTKRNLPKRNSPLSAIFAILLGALLVAACNKEPAPAPVVSKPSAPKAKKATGDNTKPVQAQSTSALRLIPAVLANQFDFSNKRDPFKPFVTIKAEPKNRQGDDKRSLRNSLPIHSFDVNQFKLIGIITGGKENKAMVTDPDGKGYVLKKGMLIGKNDGKVTSVTLNGVEILEQFRDDNGRVRKEHLKLTLPRKQ
ncbi:MAG: pilus assembly protein PilP [Desulfuromonadaceae bacterium]|nr:pilus assembly protein PilP [Desulfuromonadaceae bacterium]MDD2855598.1 pilus assembly protein PilP [Desulfuromonadaceae bacterium]